MWLHESKCVFGYNLFCWKLKTIKKNNFLTVYYCLAMFIGLNSLFMANEQCITCWFKKKKAPNANVDVNPNWPWDYKNVTLHIDITSSEPNAPFVCLLVHYHYILSYVFHLRSVWFWRWKSERKKKGKGWKSGRVEEILLSPLLYLVESGKVNGWKKN